MSRGGTWVLGLAAALSAVACALVLLALATDPAATQVEASVATDRVRSVPEASIEPAAVGGLAELPAMRSPQAVAGARLEVRLSSPVFDAAFELRGGNERIHKRADATGGASFSGLPPGLWTVRVEHDAPPNTVLAPSWARGGLRAKEASVERLVLVEGQRASVEFEVVRNGAVEGRLVDADGAPSIGSTVRLRHLDRSLLAWTASVDEEGGFRFEGVAPGPLRILTDLATVPVELELGAGATEYVELAASRAGASLRGRVVDGVGEPMVELGIVCGFDDPQSPVRDTLQRTRTDSEGRFAFTDLPAVAIALGVDPREGQRRASTSRAVAGVFDPVRRELLPGDTVELGDLVVERPSFFELDGRLLSATGAGEVNVELELGRARSGGGFEPLGFGSVSLAVDAQGRFAHRGEVPRHALRVRAFDANGREVAVPLTPVANAKLLCELEW